MLVRVKSIGDGTKGNPFRAPLPTYDTLIAFHDQGSIYVEVPETEHPNLSEHPSARFEATSQGTVLIGLDSDGHANWYSHLDERYREHKGEFRPEIV